MIKIVPDKEGKLTQWDLNRKVIITGYEGVAEVHFASPGDDHGAYVVKLVDGQAEIPNILLTMAGTINVYVYPADRTVFATTLWVMAREKPDDYIYTETEVLSYKTLDEKIGDLAKLTTIAKENLVAAINEAATKGMASIYMRVSEGYIEYSGDGVNWKQLIAVAELKGEKGDKGDPGSDATVDIVTPTAESTDKQAASAKAVWDMLGGGGSGTDISLGLTGANVGDIIKVKSVNADGKPTEWEAVRGTATEDFALVGSVTLTETASVISIDLTKECGEIYVAYYPFGATENSSASQKPFLYVNPGIWSPIANNNKLGIEMNGSSMNSDGQVYNYNLIHCIVDANTVKLHRDYQTRNLVTVGKWSIDGAVQSGVTEVTTKFEDFYSGGDIRTISKVSLAIWKVVFGVGTTLMVWGR